MKDYKLLRIWEVIYPIGIYFVVTNVVMFVLNIIHAMTNENYMIYQIIATVIAFPFIYAFYRKEVAGKWQICYEPFYLQQLQAYLV